MSKISQPLALARANGEKYYYNGKPCPKGHEGKRFVSNQCCSDCASAIGKAKVKGVKAHYHPLCAIWKSAKASFDRADFLKRFPGQYSAAHKRGIMKLICGHMPPSKTGAKWTFCRVFNLAKQYSVQGEFSDKHAGALDYALNKGYWSLISRHMDRLNSDYDAVYIWGFWRSGELVCKFGVTSERLGDRRVRHVASRAGLPIDFVILAKSSNALEAEARIKAIGRPTNLGVFSGSTEFRTLTNDELSQAYEVIYGYADGTT